MSPRAAHPRFGPYTGYGATGYGVTGWNELGDSSSNSHQGEDEDAYDVDNQEWGLEKGMELFEVSAKDATGASASIAGLG